MPTTVTTHCHYCMCLCGVQVHVEGDEVLDIESDRANPYTWQDFCRKGKTAGQVRRHPNRLLSPMRRVGDRYVPATYEEALADIATRFNRIIEQHGPDAIGTYHGNPMGFNFGGSMFLGGLLDALGTGNRFWVGSIDQNNTHVVLEAMYGSEMLSMPPDIDASDCFLLIGMDPAQSKFGWVEVQPNGWNRVLAAQQRGADLIVVDPRRSTSAQQAKTHLAVRPGQDWALLLALLHVVFTEKLDRPSTAVALTGVETVRTLAEQASLPDLAARCGIAVETLRDVARRFAQADRAVCITHTGVAHTETGTLAEWLGHVLNAVTNRLDQPGGKRYEPGYVDLVSVFSKFAPPSKHLSRLRKLPTIAGFHALAELADEILTPGPGQIRGMLIAAGNPVVSGPDGVALDRALASLDLLVAVDLVQRDSHRHAHWLIPGTHWLERQGLHALMGGVMDAPYAQYAQQAVSPPPGVRDEWHFFIDLALAMDRPLFGKKGVNTLVRASRALAHLTGRPGLAMNPGWVERALVASGKRVKYRDILAHPHGWIYDQKTYGNLAKALRTTDKTVHCAPEVFVAACRRLLAEPAPAVKTEFPMMLVNRRTRESMNSWLNETPGLFVQQRQNAVELHPDDAAALHLEEGLTARISSSTGHIELPVHLVEGGQRGIVTVAHGWGSQVFDPHTGSGSTPMGANRNQLVDRHQIDPLSQTPAFNGTPVRVEAAPETQP